MQQVAEIAQALVLVTVANGMPVLGARLFAGRGKWPVDGGLTLGDGQPLLGRSKTWRGLALALVGTTIAAAALGLPWHVGALAGSVAMAGDLVSSFVKRRLRLAPSSMAPGIDQVPEVLLPLLACRHALGLSMVEIILATGLFWIGEVGASRLLYRLGIREKPY